MLDHFHFRPPHGGSVTGSDYGMPIHGAMFQNVTSEEKREVKRLKKRTYTLFFDITPCSHHHPLTFYSPHWVPCFCFTSTWANGFCTQCFVWISQSTSDIRTQKSGKDSKMLRLFASDSVVLRLGNLSTRHWSHQTGALSSRGGWMEAWQPAGFENGSGIKALIDATGGRSTSRIVWEHGWCVSRLPDSLL